MLTTKELSKLYDTLYNDLVSLASVAGVTENDLQKYCRGLYEGLDFLNHTFLDYKNGESAIKQLALKTELTDNELKLINTISSRIHGLGFSLTCDWLKESGCLWLAKPDVHINSVIMHLKGVNKIKNDEVLQVMFSWAEAVKNSGADPSATAYKLDKIIWLLCTGEFYLDGKRIGRDAICNKI